MCVDNSNNQSVPLHKQLELIRFERGVEVCESIASHHAQLTTLELERLNIILTGKPDDPWRDQTTTLTLPSGRQETMSLHTNFKLIAREKLHYATGLAENGGCLDAAVSIYVALVLAHLFKDGNRRTAALAALYFLCRYGTPIPGKALYAVKPGDLRDEKQVGTLKTAISEMARFASRGNQGKT
ncbi:MAG: hypothetical protein A2583_01550 [Bdellovibrionales bacterium RIFOXYD1_FULL_53_11]|nr:MAG: hypothetical protein A2583_01550 [Bdellovibrionales bacterium RIFOXYD1_FULL_53_11]